MTQKSIDLPQECWELIINSLDDHRHFESLSLVSHQFLSITNHLRYSLSVTQPTLPYLPQLFNRFQNLKKVDFSQLRSDLNSILYLISRSGLDLVSVNISGQESFPLLGVKELGPRMKNLKELNCSKTRLLQDKDLVAIAESCSFLEILDISYPEYVGNFLPNGSPDHLSYSDFVSDSGILALSLKLKKLHTIDISGNLFITDKSLDSISSNLVLLRKIGIYDCDFITQNGIGLAMRNSPELSAIAVNGMGIPSIDLFFKESFAYARALCEIDLSNSFLSDELLCSIAEACLPLKKLVLSHCYNYSFAGISVLLHRYQSLEYLNLEAANFLNDESMIELSKFLHSLKFINLVLCSKLTTSTFVTLVRDCPLLNEIRMETTNLGLEDFTMDSVVNPRVKALHLARNGNLSDEFLKKVALLFPSLQVLDVSSCVRITGKGIAEILKSCAEIRHLEIKMCRQVNNLGIDYKLPKLEVLRAQGSGINDDTLSLIANSSCGLLLLDLDKCMNVTATGVKEVVENCRKLRQINLKWCNVNVDILAWMVVKRPSLRKVTPPRGYTPTDNQRNFFLRHGCLVCKG